MVGVETRSKGWPEPVGGAGQRPDRADLHRVAGEVGVERLAVGGADELVRAPLEELDERVPGDLLREPGAAGAGDAALPVEQHLAGDRDRLGEGALVVGEAGVALPVRHRLVLQRALAALVAHRAVERVVDEQELHHPALRLLRDRGGELGAHGHPLGAGGGARGERLDLPGHLDQALPARPGRLQQRVVAEAGDLDPEQLGGADDQRPLGDGELEPVDGHGDPVGDRCRRRLVGLQGHRVIALPRCRRPRGWRRPGRTGSRPPSDAGGIRPGST